MINALLEMINALLWMAAQCSKFTCILQGKSERIARRQFGAATRVD
jgi:hypothetical protein